MGGSIWDIKKDIQDYPVEIGIEGSEAALRKDKVGNIHYGYVGTAIGFRTGIDDLHGPYSS